MYLASLESTKVELKAHNLIYFTSIETKNAERESKKRILSKID